MKLMGAFIAALLTMASLAPAQTSALWGEHGEKWAPDGRLPDFSYAGYHEGRDPLPSPPVVINVRDLGAKGDGDTDDTAAFEKAIADARDGAILIPAGRYKIIRQLVIGKSNLVLRGEGPDKTTLFFPIPLNTLDPKPVKNTGGTPTNSYSWSGGMIHVRGSASREPAVAVVADAPRGSNTIELSEKMSVQPGDRVEIIQQDADDQSLVKYLYNGDSGDIRNFKNARISLVARVQRIEGHRLFLDRPLRTDVRQAWGAQVKPFAPSVTEVGVERMTIEFPNTPYLGHFTEVGFNPLAFSGVSDCWARDLRIVNADSGPFVGGRFCTIDGIVYDAQRQLDRRGNAGHHGIGLSSDNLVTNFRFNIRFIHDLTVSNLAAGNVFSKGSGVDLCFDGHRRAPFANLYTEIDCGKGTRLWEHGGGSNLGRAMGAWTTWWNIRADRPQQAPPRGYAPDLVNFVGIAGKAKSTTDPAGRWWETIAPDQLQPQNLYEAQKRFRSVGGPPEMPQ